MLNETQIVTDIRSASRDMIRQLGLMSKTVAGTDLSISTVHAIIEIGNSDGLSSKHLGEKLSLEKSTISRLIKPLVDKGEVVERRSDKDGRIKLLHLTSSGNQRLNVIERFAQAQVSNALHLLDDNDQRGVLKGLQNYSAALKNSGGSPEQPRQNSGFAIKSGYASTIIGRVVSMMHAHMSRHYDFAAAFESRIATDIADFVSRLDMPRNNIWHAETSGQIVGSISIDGRHFDDGFAHLRWFVVSDEVRGNGVGNALLENALSFCDDKGFPDTHLWTVKGLDAARKLYEQHGFVLAEEYEGDQWGKAVMEQKFIRTRGAIKPN